ncbi:MAG TPA: patatin-like phospholipase family protein [Candidatus Binatia bacterium]|jgi:NTE family protein|nr:patatin-like phospholipase family protein [Candidatus Binatia bacterium]
MSFERAVPESLERHSSNGNNGHSSSAERSFLTDSNSPRTPPSVVTLAFLSEHIPAPALSEELARSLAAETGEQVVLVQFEAPGANGAKGNGTHDLVFRDGFPLVDRVLTTQDGFHSLTVGLRNGPLNPAGTASLLEQLSRRFRFVLIEVLANERPAPWVLEFLRRSGTAYLFLRAATQDVYHLDLMMREVRAPGRISGVCFKPIACLGEGEEIDGFDKLVQRVAGPVHTVVHGCPGAAGLKEAAWQPSRAGTFHKDLRRLAREIGGCQVGLALSSGAAKGFAHAGVIQVLEENGIEIDVVAGASMGAYVGALWTAGLDGGELERLARELQGRWALWTLIDPVFPPRRGFLRGFAVKKRLMRSIGHRRFADLVRPLRVVAGNLATLESVVFSSGEVATAVHASIAVPGICVPITIDGETYIDGGIVDPLPVGVLRDMGVSRVIAVDVIPTPDRISYGLQAEQELARHNETWRQKVFRRFFPVDQQLNYFARGNVFEVLMRSIYGAQIRLAQASGRQADLVLRPDICDNRWLDFRMPGKFIALGREAAERHLDEIKALVARREVNHEQAPTTVAAIA